MVFIRPGAAGTHGAPRAALRRAAGAKKIIRSSVSELVSLTFFLRPEATGTRDTPELSCAGRRVLEPTEHVLAWSCPEPVTHGAPRADLRREASAAPSR
jgi:hypothetical protein